MYIHQTLHGYQHGHNKLNSSIILPPIDEDRMKILSDWSEYAGGIDGDMSYITVYPLSQDNLFVIAKTWYADEMSRPGCVWTHSLIIDLSEIDDSFDFRKLKYYFHRPSDDKYSYDKNIEVNAIDNDNTNVSIRRQDIWILYNLIVQNKTSLILGVEDTSMYYQDVILSILQYLPIGIIKNLRICTGASSIRKDGTTKFNITFSSVTANALSSLSIQTESIDGQQSGILYICESLCNKDSEISQLIRLFSKDIGANYTEINTLGFLLKALSDAYNGNSSLNYDSLLNSIVRAFPTSNAANTLKHFFFGMKVGLLFATEENYYVQISKLSDKVFTDWQSLEIESAAERYMSSSPQKFVNLISNLVSLDSMNNEGRKIINKAAQMVSGSMLSNLCVNNWSVYFALVLVRAELLSESYWLSLPVNKVAVLLPIVEKIDKPIKYWDKILSYILINSLDVTSNFAHKIYSNYSNTISLIMEFMQKHNCTSIPNAIHELCITNNKDIIMWMKEQNNLSSSIAHYIMKIIPPTSKDVKDLGIEPWIVFSNIDVQSTDYVFHAFLFCLSLNWKSAISLKILKRSFFYIYIGMSKDELPIREFNNLRPYMEELPFWQSWDNCKKLRKGIVKAMKRLGYNRNDIDDFTPSADLNSTLLKIWDKQ